MKNWTLIPLAILLAVAASALTTAFMSPDGRAVRGNSTNTAASESAARLERMLADIEKRQVALERSIADMEVIPAPVATRSAAHVSPEEIERVVAAWMDKNATKSAPADDQDYQLSGGVAGIPLDALMDMLAADGYTNMELQDLWQKVRDAERMDEVIAELEGLCDMDPNNPDLRLELGNAYIQKIFDVGNGPLAGVFGTKADDAYDQALEIDPGHWEARFSKAVALSNWPAFLGKTGEAIEHFEILVTQQAQAPPQDSYAQSYLFLGNMYQQTGASEKALKAWQDGAQLYPNDEALRDQLRLAGQ